MPLEAMGGVITKLTVTDSPLVEVLVVAVVVVVPVEVPVVVVPVVVVAGEADELLIVILPEQSEFTV